MFSQNCSLFVKVVVIFALFGTIGIFGCIDEAKNENATKEIKFKEITSVASKEVLKVAIVSISPKMDTFETFKFPENEIYCELNNIENDNIKFSVYVSNRNQFFEKRKLIHQSTTNSPNFHVRILPDDMELPSRPFDVSGKLTITCEALSTASGVRVGLVGLISYYHYDQESWIFYNDDIRKRDYNEGALSEAAVREQAEHGLGYNMCCTFGDRSVNGDFLDGDEINQRETLEETKGDR